MPPVRAPRQRRKEARPREIVDAALDIFTETGFAAARLDDVAARAGVSKGTLYLYFPSKEELFKAVVRTAVLPNIARAERLAARHAGPQAELLRTMVELAARRALRSRLGGIPKLMLSEAGKFPDLARFYLEEVILRGVRLLGGAVRRGIASGEFRPVPVEHTVRSLMAPVLFIVMWRYAFAPVAPVAFAPLEFLRSHLDLVLAGLRPQPAETGDGR
ncbi:MAG: TetR/AcrR family transcriptional regulator [Geminicoccaceae bacterium]